MSDGGAGGVSKGCGGESGQVRGWIGGVGWDERGMVLLTVSKWVQRKAVYLEAIFGRRVFGCKDKFERTPRSRERYRCRERGAYKRGLDLEKLDSLPSYPAHLPGDAPAPQGKWN